MKNIMLLFLFLVFTTHSQAELVVFEIQPGTGENPWNSEENTLNVRVGDVLRITNNDSVVHQLHTNGSPCAHGPRIQPGHFWDCNISREYNLSTEGPLYDHNFYDTGLFWLHAVKQPE